jgi:hypothetical protein
MVLEYFGIFPGKSNSPTRNLKGEMAMALDKFKFRRLGKHFLWNQATIMKFSCVR